MTFVSLLESCIVATAPTVYGIETSAKEVVAKAEDSVATAPTVYGIETLHTEPQ